MLDNIVKTQNLGTEAAFAETTTKKHSERHGTFQLPDL
jgi:hypothetical protein